MAMQRSTRSNQSRKETCGILAVVHIVIAVFGVMFALNDLGNQRTYTPFPTIDLTALQTPAVRTALAGTLEGIRHELPMTFWSDDVTPAPPAPAFSVSLQRGPCVGRCPVYELYIDGSGVVTYEGRSDVAVVGPQTEQLSPAQVEELMAAVRQAGFFSGQVQSVAPNTDLPATRLAIMLDWGNKRIEHPSSVHCLGDAEIVPPPVCELENKIDEIVNSKQWVGAG